MTSPDELLRSVREFEDGLARCPDRRIHASAPFYRFGRLSFRPKAPGGPARGERVERVLPPERSASSAARDFVKTTLAGWGLSRLADDAALIATELFSNALRHAPSPQYVLAIDWNDGKVRIEMWDSGDLLPRKQNPGLDAETGRGLHLVEALSTAWGSRHAASAKCVWAVL